MAKTTIKKKTLSRKPDHCGELRPICHISGVRCQKRQTKSLQLCPLMVGLDFPHIYGMCNVFVHHCRIKGQVGTRGSDYEADPFENPFRSEIEFNNIRNTGLGCRGLGVIRRWLCRVRWIRECWGRGVPWSEWRRSRHRCRVSWRLRHVL